MMPPKQHHGFEVGQRVKVVLPLMSDPLPPPVGATGTVDEVYSDDLHDKMRIAWDEGVFAVSNYLLPQDSHIFRVAVEGDDGRTHHVGDDCGDEHYESDGRLLCGGDFMAGTICSEQAGHEGPHGTPCPRCGGDWMEGTCTCEEED